MPEHTPLFFAEAMRCVAYLPVACMLPFAGRELEKERDVVRGLDRIKERAIGGRQCLVAAPARARIENAVAGSILRIGVARIDLSEICKQRNGSPVTVVNSNSCPMCFVDLVP